MSVSSPVNFPVFPNNQSTSLTLGEASPETAGGHLVEKSLALASQVRLQELQVPTEPSSQALGGWNALGALITVGRGSLAPFG